MRVLLTTMGGERRTITLKHRHHIAKLVVRKLREADRLLDGRPGIPAVYGGKNLRIDYTTRHILIRPLGTVHVR